MGTNDRPASIPNNAEFLMTHVMTDKTLWMNGNDLDLRPGNLFLDAKTFRFEKQGNGPYYRIVNVRREKVDPRNKYVFANDQGRIHMHNDTYTNFILWEPFIVDEEGDCTHYVFRHKATGEYMYNGVTPRNVHLRERGSSGDEPYIRWCLRSRPDRIPTGPPGSIANNTTFFMTHVMTDKPLWKNGSDLDLTSENPSRDAKSFRFEQQGGDGPYYRIVNIQQEKEDPQNKYVFANDQGRIHMHNDAHPNYILWEPFVVDEGGDCTSYAFRHKGTGLYMYNGVTPRTIHLRERFRPGDELYFHWCLHPRGEPSPPPRSPGGPPSDGGGGNGFPTWAIALIIVAVIAIMFAVALLVYRRGFLLFV